MTLPSGVSGEFYIIVQADSGNQVYEGADDDNNAKATTTPIIIDPATLALANLTVLSVDAPPEAISEGCS